MKSEVVVQRDRMSKNGKCFDVVLSKADCRSVCDAPLHQCSCDPLTAICRTNVHALDVCVFWRGGEGLDPHATHDFRCMCRCGIDRNSIASVRTGKIDRFDLAICVF